MKNMAENKKKIEKDEEEIYNEGYQKGSLFKEKEMLDNEIKVFDDLSRWIYNKEPSPGEIIIVLEDFKKSFEERLSNLKSRRKEIK